MRGLAMALALVVWQMSAAAAGPAVANVRRFSSVITELWVKRAVQGAAERLRGAECARVLTDYTDATGRPLADAVTERGLSPAEYLLTAVWFYDGENEPTCDPRMERMAITMRGSHVVFVCPARFMSTPHEREIAIIHEMLHSLGLGEDPPSSRDITMKVIARCGREPQK